MTYSKMSNVVRRLLGVSALGVTLVLAGCPGDHAGGYDKVSYREQTTLAMAAAPDPPPAIAGFAGGGAAATPTLDPATAPSGVTQAMVEAGQQSFGTVCAACHGAGGTGTPAGPALGDAEWIHISGQYEEIVAIINAGVAQPEQFPGAMPPRGGGNFTDDQVRGIAAYIYALSHGGS
jgi:mono/diheme cytochrome c family protein